MKTNGHRVCVADTPDFSQRRTWAADQAISFLMQQAVENRDVISLAAGLVDQETLPVRATFRALEHLFSDPRQAQQALQYGTTEGAECLRTELLEHLARLEDCSTSELGITTDQLILTTGSQQMLALVADMLLDPGDICLVAAPTYFVFLGTLSGVGVRAVSVEADADGMRMDALESELEQLDMLGELDRVKLIYLVSYYENPSGVSLEAQRREDVVEIAKRWSKQNRIVILEDAAYRELRYDGPRLPSVWSFDVDRDTVILTETFSKSFSPGLRVGFAVLPQELVKPLCDLKGNEDFGSANFNQHLLATVLKHDLYEPHVRQLCEAYRVKRDRMLAAAERCFREILGVSWYHPHGGLYVWMTLPENVDTGFGQPLFHQATEVEGVMYVPGGLCYAEGDNPPPQNHLRLSFGVQSMEGIDRGMERLAKAIRTVLGE